MGTDLSQTQIEKLVALKKEIIVAFDADTAGRENAPIVTRQLRQSGVKTLEWGPPKAYKDLGEVPASELSDWIEEGRQDQELLDSILDGGMGSHDERRNI